MNPRSLLFSGTLATRTPIHPGSGEGNALTDKCLRRDARGRLLLPGTAIGGALRTLATRLAPALGAEACAALNDGATSAYCGCPVCTLFGELNPNDEEGEGGNASHLLIDHAPAELPENATTQIRDGVGIERHRGTAAGEAAAKFDQELLPTGTRFALRIEWQCGDDPWLDQLHARLLAAALGEWRAGRGWLGGGAARGLGALALEGLEIYRRDLGEVERLMDFLATDPTPGREHNPEQDRLQPDWLDRHLTAARAATAPTGGARRFARWQLRLSFGGPFLVNDPEAAVRSGFDHHPLVEQQGGEAYPLLPGASLRGALRQQAERIARTLTTARAKDAAEFGRLCPACDPLARPPAGEKAALTALASCDALAEADSAPAAFCPGCRLFGANRFGSRLRVEGGRTAPPAADTVKVYDYLAVDRFTGGGIPGAKFDAMTLMDPCFDIALHLEEPEEWELGWLTLSLRDLAEGLIPIGFGAAKGLGRVKTVTGTLHLGYLRPGDLPSGVEPGASDPATGIYRERILNWDDGGSGESAATAWVDAFLTRIEGFERAPSFRLERDHYFGRDAAQDYPMEQTRWLKA
jgi:CRISPR/Cas system CSM-associated protein Csm3 (group 7 of RAMP superfamily)